MVVRFFGALSTDVGAMLRLSGRVIATGATGAAYASSASSAPGSESAAVAAAGEQSLRDSS